MSNSLPVSDERTAQESKSSVVVPYSDTGKPSLLWTTLGFSIAIMLIMTIGNFAKYTDYVGADNDDVMRLVQVRDFLAGQSWFDMHQYRLGLADGTLMHWSRLIDAPIALLISIFSLFMPYSTAEIAGVSLWPQLLVIPVLWAMGKGGFYLGGRPTMLIAQGLAAIYLLGVHRFHPGSIDHHNVQVALISIIVAMFLDPEKRASSFAISGFCAALALAIGVETTPLVAVCATLVAILWAIMGPAYSKAALSFGLTLAASVTLLFFATTPTSLYASVTCDNLSIGFASISAAGGVCLALASLTASRRSMLMRFVSLGVSGALVGALTLKIAPQCLHNPLDALDPLLQTMWLQYVSEAQSIFSEWTIDKATFGAFYAVGFLSIIACAVQLVRGKQVLSHAILLVLAVISFLIAAYQIRASIFSNFIAFFPLSLLIAEAQARSREAPKDVKRGLVFFGLVLASVPAVWGVVGILSTDWIDGIKNQFSEKNETDSKICRTETDLNQLAALPVGVVAGPSNLGAHILRYTPHRAISAPYHRNQAGLLAELKLEMASPTDAQQMLATNKINYYALCKTDGETALVVETYPNGFLAQLTKGNVPDFMEKLATPAGSNLTIYTVKTQTPST